MDKVRELETLIRAKYPLLYILSAEEQRVESLLRQVAAHRSKRLFGWTVTEGLQDWAGSKAVIVDAKMQDPLVILDWIADSDENAIFVLKDFHSYMDDTRQPLDAERALVIRRLRDVVNALKESRKTMVLLSPVVVIPSDLEKDITLLDYSRPTADELYGALERVIRSARQRSVAAEVDGLDDEVKARLVRAAQGLTCTEAENAFAKSLVLHKTLDVDVILEEKKHLLRKATALEYFVAPEAFTDIGGMAELKEWLRKRGAAFGEAAKRFGLPTPKGLLLLGVQGGGKSLMAKAVARQWHLPLLRLDMGRVFGEMVGASEANMRQAMKVAESVAPCVLWLDELEKGLAGSASSGRSDGGTAARVLATFLTWMQEKQSPVFVVATSNEVRQLPPELLRKGRFDEIFFVDLPNEAERREIWTIHLQKRKRNVNAFDLKRLAAETQGFSGAEIEQVLIAALYDAFDERRDVEMLDLVRVITQTVPLSETMKKEVETLRKWAKEHARPAGAGEAQFWEIAAGTA
jgi:SpoVK/Ycf46/Vps4 family AAA+-type ATPase